MDVKVRKRHIVRARIGKRRQDLYRKRNQNRRVGKEKEKEEVYTRIERGKDVGGEGRETERKEKRKK